MKRRDFLKSAALSTGGLALDALASTGETAERPAAAGPSNAAMLPRREYGKTAIQLSIIALGGLVVTKTDQDHANRVVAEAVERGVNYFDVAPTYGNGEAETRLGPALEPYRKNVFLACKTLERRREGAAAELKRSLERLRTDHLDLYQLHAIADVKKDLDVIFGKGGAMEVFLEARKSGQVRFLGFSAHSVEAALAALDRYDFDSVLFPVNFTCFYKGSFGPQIIEKARSKGAARLALKGLARQQWPKGDPQRKKFSKCWYQPLTDPREAELGLRFTLSQSVTAAVPPGEESLFRLALDIAMKFQPITPEEEEELKALAATLNPIFAAA
jgi:aryl-alcohol dehydrogenase-like predicted oxidoreductase